MNLMAIRSYVFPFLITLALSLSIHVISLEVGVGYPDIRSTFLMGLFVYLTSILGYIILSYFVVEHYCHNKRFFVKVITVFVLMMMLNESLIRGPVMQGLVSHAYVYSFLTSVPEYLKSAFLSLVMVTGYDIYARKSEKKVACIVFVIVFMVAIVVNFTFSALAQPIIEWATQLSVAPDPEMAITWPYGKSVLIPAYLTFAFPTLSAFVYYKAFSEGLKLENWPKATLFVVTVLSAKGYLAIIIFAGSVSFLQFVAEYAVLALLAAFFVERLTKKSLSKQL